MLTLTTIHTIEIEVTETLLRLGLLGLLTLTIAFFVAAELALVSASKERIYRISQEETSGVRRSAAEQVHHAQTHIEQYLSVTQTGTTAGSLLLGWLGEGATVHWIEPWISRLPIGHLPAMITSHSLAVAIAFLLVTYVEIVLGELVPKVLAASAPEETALLLIRPLELCAYLLSPLLVVLNGTVGLLTSRLKRTIPVVPSSQTPLVQVDPYTARVAGTVGISTINDELGLNLPPHLAYQTIAGFMIHHLGRVPEQSDRLNWGDLELEALSVADDSLQTISLRRVTVPLKVAESEPVLVQE